MNSYHSFRGKCAFKPYIPSKFARYLVKIQTLCGARTWYSLNKEVFNLSNSSMDVVMRLVQSMIGSGRNVTADNWFSSIPLTEELLNKRISFVGTLRKKTNRSYLKNFLMSKKGLKGAPCLPTEKI